MFHRSVRTFLFGVGVSALLSGSALAAPVVSPATAAPPPGPAAVSGGSLSLVPRDGNRPAFRYASADGGTTTPIGFVSTGGTVRVQPLGEGAHSMRTAKTGEPASSPRAAVASAATSYRTTIRIDSSEWTARGSLINVWNRDTWIYQPIDNPGDSLTATADLPPGNYFVGAIYGIYDVDSYLLTASFTVTNKAQTVVLAQSAAKEIALRVDDPTAQHSASAVWVSLPNGDLMGSAGGYRNTRTFVTTTSTPGTTLRTNQVLTRKGTTALNPSPYRYNLTRSWAHPFPSSLISTTKTASLAKTTTTVRAQGINTPGYYESVATYPDSSGSFLATPMTLPATFVEYVTPDVQFQRMVRYGGSQYLDAEGRTLPAGLSPPTTIGAGPLMPGRRNHQDDSRRQWDRLHILENMPYADTAGNRGYDYDSTVTAELSVDGKVLKTSNTGVIVADVPAREQTYRLKQTHTRIAASSQLSTRTDSDWTFVSGSTMNSLLDLMDLAVTSSGLDQRNRAGAAPVALTVTASTRNSAKPGTVRAVEWSTDDGATWNETPLTATGTGVVAEITVPASAAFVSLRFTADNDQGGKLIRTVLRAFAGRATGADEKSGGVTVSDVKVNGGRALTFGTSGTAEFTATFTASAPSGVAGAGVFLWHGAYDTPDGVEPGTTLCTPVNATTANCAATFYVYDSRYTYSGNVLAGTWYASAWATAKDGSGLAHRHRAGNLVIKRETRLTGANAAPEPVRKGKTITITSTLTRADWSTGAYAAYAGRPVTLQWYKRGGKKWVTVKSVKSNAKGQLKTTVKATADGYYRFVYATDATSASVTSLSDYIDVR